MDVEQFFRQVRRDIRQIEFNAASRAAKLALVNTIYLLEKFGPAQHAKAVADSRFSRGRTTLYHVSELAETGKDPDSDVAIHIEYWHPEFPAGNESEPLMNVLTLEQYFQLEIHKFRFLWTYVTEHDLLEDFVLEKMEFGDEGPCFEARIREMVRWVWEKMGFGLSMSLVLQQDSLSKFVGEGMVFYTKIIAGIIDEPIAEFGFACFDLLPDELRRTKILVSFLKCIDPGVVKFGLQERITSMVRLLGGL